MGSIVNHNTCLLLSNLKTLVDLYQQDQRTGTIVTQLQSDTATRTLLTGIVGAQDCMVIAGMLADNKGPLIYIANTKEEAAYVQNTLSQLVERKVTFFPDSFKRPLLFEELNNNNSVERTEVVNAINLNSKQGHVIVTYPEAIFEKVVDPKLLEANQIVLKKGEDLDTDTVIEVLVEYGFEHNDFVYEPGQFSIRGGIVDIFSFGNEWPYRIELFDQEIESIRTFDPTSQLSIDKVDLISIIPNINSKFKQSQKVSLFTLFDKNTSVWVQDMQMLIDKIQICFDKAKDYATSLAGRTNDELREIFDERAFMYPGDIINSIDGYHIVLLSPSQEIEGEVKKVDFKSKPQPSFNKNFSLLIEDLNRNTSDKVDNYIFTDNKKQIERFYNIFEDLDANVTFHPVLHAIHKGFIDPVLRVACYTDHQIFERFHKYKLRQGFTKDQALNLKMLRELETGDYVVHIDHGIGRYSGLEKIDINGHIQESVRLIYLNNDILYVGINSLHKISKYVGKDGSVPGLSKIGGDAWKNLKRKTKSKVKDIAKDLIKLYAKRKASKGFAFAEDSYLQAELEASFIFEDTPDQAKATEEVKEDMIKPYPMDRLICGDVGFGKTEIAIRAAFKAVVSGKQVAILVPTTILALQHYKTFHERLKSFDVKVDYINRFRTAKEKTQIFKDIKEGKTDILIGTHAILSKRTEFKDLGLLVIDEEQKFGVAAKEKLRSFKVNVDTLTLTATPIPRTLQFSLMSARDLSVLRTPPPNRQPIHTERRVFSEELVRDAIYYEVNRGGQVFFVHNRVKSLPTICELIRRMCPDVSVQMAHGQMDSKVLEKSLVSFIEGEYDVIVCTNIIETGLDISNANTIIINNANQFGLSDLHQLRGRVGRSNRKAFCYLFAPPLSVLTSDARKRLKVLEEFSDLGSGFNIAMRDLDIRGAGNLLGSEQSGFVTDIGYDTFQKILEEAMMELKENDYKDLFKEQIEKKKEYVRDVEVDADVEMLIPDEYVSNIQERLSLYTELNELKDEAQIDKYKQNMRDRFGPVPKSVNELLDGIRITWACKQLGFERISLKSRKLRCYFIRNPQSSYYETEHFQAILGYVGGGAGQRLGFTLKQTSSHLILIKESVDDLRNAKRYLDKIINAIAPKLDAV